MAITPTTYANWKPGDIINICASINEFCGTSNFVYAYDINVTTSPNACTLQFGTQGSCSLHLNNVELTFKLVGFAGSVESKSCAPQQTYKTLGSYRTNSNGVASLQYTVTDQDRLNYENASGSGYQYVVMACISNSDGQATISSQTSIVTYPITIVQNLCIGVTCSEPICVNNNLYESKCDPTTGLCIADTSRLIVSPCPTHYIEWNFSSLDSGFLNFMLANTTSLSNWLGTHLPTPPNIVYKKAEYVTGKFRIYVNYTAPTSNYLYSQLSTAELYDYSLKLYSPENEVMKLYNSANGEYANINSLSPGIFDWVTSGINLLLDTFARIISTIILFMIAGQFAIEFGLGVGIVAAVIAMAVSYYLIKDINLGTTTTGSPPPTTPVGKVTTVKEFVDGLISTCDASYPTCAANPPTCDSGTMRAYLSCINNAKLAQCQYTVTQQGLPLTNCDAINTERQREDACLTNGTCTPTAAKNSSTTIIVNPTDQMVDNAIQQLCNTTPGYKYNTDTKKCEQVCNVPVLGFCLDTPILIGELLIGGYIVYKIAKGWAKTKKEQ